MGFLTFEAVLFVVAICIDSLAASFALGMEKIKVSIISAVVINIVCTSFLFVALICGSFISSYISAGVISYISFSILFILGILRLLDIIIKKYINKKNYKIENCKNKIGRFFLTIYADSSKADVNNSKTLSVSEAVTLAVALSIDSLAAGFGIGILNVNYTFIICLNFIFGMGAVILGCFIGRKIALKTNFDLSFISGIVLIALAFMRI